MYPDFISITSRAPLPARLFNIFPIAWYKKRLGKSIVFNVDIRHWELEIKSPLKQATAALVD
jgi:hypothetical protein